MSENINPTGGGNQAEKFDDFSIFRENYQKKMKEIAELEQRIAERQKLIEKETDAETVKKIKEEIMTLEKEKQRTRHIAGIELKKHERSTKILEDFDPDERIGKA